MIYSTHRLCEERRHMRVVVLIFVLFLALIVVAAITGVSHLRQVSEQNYSVRPRRENLAPNANDGGRPPIDSVLNKEPVAPIHIENGPPQIIDKNEPRWVVVHKDDFSDPASVKNYYQCGGGVLRWNEKFKAMQLHNDIYKSQIYAAVHRALPGDLRVSFRALRRKSTEEVNIGMVISVKGVLADEDGYFVEWEYGTAVIKKNNREKKRVSVQTPSTPDRWLKFEVVKVGGHFTLTMQGQVSLEWTDPEPYKDSEHDLFSFYVYAESTLIDDLVIERNANDSIAPLSSDPATDDNILNGIRD